MQTKTTHYKNLLPTIIRMVAVVLPLLLAIALAASSWAYGPERKTFSINSPADYITFNAITDNPNYGDERNFVIAKDASHTGAGGWSADELKVQDGKEYLVRMYVHNNAADNLNLTAKNTRVSANIPATYARSHQIDGFITADNANPNRVWDSVILKGDKDFIVKFVGGSTRYYNNVNPSSGFALPDSIVTSAGAQVGYESMNGDVPGCFEYSGIATFRVKVTMRKEADFALEKKVRAAGSEEWKDSIKAKVGDKLEYRIGYDNTGKTVQNNVIVRDTPPKGIDFVSGSSTLKNATNSSGNGKAIGSDSLVASTGVNIGNYTPSSNAYIYYSAFVTKDDLRCGENRLVNTASASTNNGRKSDTAEVVVAVECAPNECKPGIPEGDERCDDGVVVPGELPTTGPAEIMAGILGVTLVSLGVAYWIRSRQEYRRALAGFSQDSTEEPERLLEERTDHRDGQEDRFRPVDNLHANRYHGGRRW